MAGRNRKAIIKITRREDGTSDEPKPRLITPAATWRRTAKARRFCPPTSPQGLLEPCAGRPARTVLRGAGHSNVPGLPGRSRSRRPSPSGCSYASSLEVLIAACAVGAGGDVELAGVGGEVEDLGCARAAAGRRVAGSVVRSGRGSRRAAPPMRRRGAAGWLRLVAGVMSMSRVTMSMPASTAA